MGLIDDVLGAVAHPIRTGRAVNAAVAQGAHWAFPHDPFAHPGAQASQVGHQLASSFDPRSRGGLANLASLFAGGSEGDMPPSTEEILQGGHPAGEFHAYGRLKGGEHVTGSPLDRGLTNEGPIRPGKNYNPSMQKMVEGVHTNPFLRASRESASREMQNLQEKQTSLDLARQNAARAMVARKQLDQHLGSAPMAGRAEDPTATSDQGMHSDQAQHFMRRQGQTPDAIAQHQATLNRFYAAQLHNHRN